MALTAPVSILTGGPGTGQDPHPAGRPDAGPGQAAALPARRPDRPRGQADGGGDRAGRRARSTACWSCARAARPGATPTTRWTPTWWWWTRSACSTRCSPTSWRRRSRAGAHLLLVGDPDQLPSVGAGDVLADLLRSERFPVTRLEHIFRQGAGSGIARNARRVNAGEMPRFGGDDHRLLLPAGRGPGGGGRARWSTSWPSGCRAATASAPARSRCSRRCTAARPGSARSTPLLQERLNPYREGVPEARGGGRAYRPGDRVLQLKNDYDLKVFNGDLGTVRAIDPTEQEVVLDLDDGREVRYPYASLYRPDPRLRHLGPQGPGRRVPGRGDPAGDQPRRRCSGGRCSTRR